MNEKKIRLLDDQEAKELIAGDDHYRAFVGPPKRYDLMGAMQFRLLSALGLRENHRVLDFGCGSLRVGRMLIPFLQAGNYYGVEPNQWLIKEAVDKHLGNDIIKIKQPEFSFSDNFTVPFDGVVFNIILAQSIFSHTGADIMQILLGNISRALAPNGLVAATFSMSKNAKDCEVNGWIYPGCVRYSMQTIIAQAQKAGLIARSIPFYHPSQNWFLMASDERLLPTDEQMTLLKGAVFNVEDFSASVVVRDDSIT